MDIPRSSSDSQRLESLFNEVVELDSESRLAYLDRVCADDPDLRREIESLLAAYDSHAVAVRSMFERLPLATPASDEVGPKASGEARGLSGRQIGHYRILEQLGGGGMGVVYQAYDPRLDRTLALKFLPRHLHADDEAKTRFTQEAKTASALDHANICTIHDIGETDDGQMFIAMSYYAGDTLKKKIADGPLSLSEALDYTIQAAKGLDKAHAAGIIHRDVKPANLLVTEDGVVKILDFGIAKISGVNLTKTGTTMGTVAYMSPEQIKGQDIDERTDVWSLGAVLYETITGSTAFKGDSDPTLIHAVLDAEPDFGAIESPEVRAVVEACLRKDPSERFASIADLAEALDAIASGLGLAALSIPRRRRTAPILTIGMGVIGVVIIGVTTWLFSKRTPEESLEAPGRQMLVVLPFENLGDPRDQYLADGMAEELSMRLSAVKSLGVISRNTASQYRETKKTTPEIGKELGVDYIVGGTVRWDSLASGSRRLGIASYLTRVSDDTQVWAEAYDRGTADILDLQRSLAMSIVQQMKTTLDPADVEQLEAKLTDNPDAHEEYLKGIAVMKEPLPPARTIAELANATEDRATRAIAHFHKALELDTLFVEAALRIVRIAAGIYDSSYWNPGWPVNAKMDTLALEAASWTTRVAPNSREDLLANAIYDYRVKKDLAEAMALFSRALDLFEDADVLGDVAEIQAELKNLEFAIDYEDRAIALDPRNNGRYIRAAQWSHYLRQFRSGLRYWERAAEIDSNLVRICHDQGIVLNLIRIDRSTRRARAMFPDSVQPCVTADFWDRRFDHIVERADSGEHIWPPMLAVSYERLGRRDDARKVYEELKTNSRNFKANPWGFLAWADAGLGDREAALSELAEFKDWTGRSRKTSMTNFRTFAAQVYLLLGMKDELFEVLDEDASKPGWMNAEWLHMAFFDSVRDDPRFAAVTAKFEKWEENWR